MANLEASGLSAQIPSGVTAQRPSASSLPAPIEVSVPATLSGDAEERPSPLKKIPLSYMIVPNYMGELLLDGLLVLLICFLILMLLRRKELNFSYGAKVLFDPDSELLA